VTVTGHCHIAVFDQAVIVLDIRRGRYLLYDRTCAKALADRYIDRSAQNNFPALQQLIADGIITGTDPADRPVNIFDYRALRFERFSSSVWANRTMDRRHSRRFELEPIARLTWSAILLKLSGLKALELLGKQKIHARNPEHRAGMEESGIAERYFNASIWSPFRITCLQMSMAIVSQLRREGIDAQLVIGVRPVPFVAHAWVEIGHSVYGDVPDVQSNYGEIYRIPEISGD